MSAFDEEKDDVEMALIGSAAPDRHLGSMVQGLEIHIGKRLLRCSTAAYDGLNIACGQKAASLGRGAMELVIKAIDCTLFALYRF